MSKPSVRPVIRLRGVRQNNLKNFDLDLPLNQLIVVTGVSGSGKSSLAFDTLYAEGQRRYIETFSPYARQFFDRMDKPHVDSIEGIPPAIAIEQRNAVRTTRSTVGTMTEICDFMKVVWPHLARLHCRNCGQPVREDSPRQIWEAVIRGTEAVTATPTEVLVTFDLPLSSKLSFQESLALIAKQGYQRVLVEGEILRLDELEARDSAAAKRPAITVVQDRLKLAPGNRSRFTEACGQAYHFGKGRLSVHRRGGAGGLRPEPLRFSKGRHCATCDLEYREPSPALFSFNHPMGACPACRGFGRVITIDYNLAIPDRSKTLAQGVVKPWRTGMSADCQRDLMRACRHFDIPTDVPFEKLPEKWQNFVIDGEKDYGKDEEHEWPRAWYGVKGFFRWLESRAYKMHVRVLLSRYRAYTPCPECMGQRFQPETLLYRLDPGIGHDRSLTLADFYLCTISEAHSITERLASGRKAAKTDPLDIALGEVRERLGYLVESGLGYLTLDRPTRSLSGGETERVNLTTCLGTRLVNTMFVLDEPSVGLHARDTGRLVKILRRLQRAGNTVVVVEHEASIMREADQIVDLGPGQGETGGNIVFQGPGAELLQSEHSITGLYLSGRKQIELPIRRPVTQAQPSREMVGNYRTTAPARSRGRSNYFESTTINDLTLNDRIAIEPPQEAGTGFLTISGASCNNLRDLTVEFPLGRLICVTGVSGSGKTTLIREILLPALNARLGRGINGAVGAPAAEAEDDQETNAGSDTETESDGNSQPTGAAVRGWESLGQVVMVDQTSLGRTPRSNPAVYAGAFNDIRDFFARSPEAEKAGLSSGAFSFNSPLGQCQACRGAGFEKIEMQFLSDVFIRCQECDGRRYRPKVLEVKLSLPAITGNPESKGGSAGRPPRNGEKVPAFSIADLLESTIDEGIRFLEMFPGSVSARRAAAKLGLLREVGLGYLRLGQPINTLSGGESQRLKLVRHLAAATSAENLDSSMPNGDKRTSAPTLFLFDEPTTGLHFDDVRMLLKVFQRLVDAGQSVIVIEHNLEVIKSADWVIDLGPEAGAEGGRVVAAGTPEEVARCEGSHTGRFLREVMGRESKIRTRVNAKLR
jgi:excinuclease ABC subunit A